MQRIGFSVAGGFVGCICGAGLPSWGGAADSWGTLHVAREGGDVGFSRGYAWCKV